MAMVLLMTIPATGFCFDVTARVDKTRISREDSVLLQVEVNGGKADDLDLSMIKDFKVIPRGSSSSFNYINGKSERKATYQYVLIPLSKGRLKIPAVKAVKDGQTAFTREMSVLVKENVVESDDVRDQFAKISVAQSSLFVGQQTVFTLKFFTSKRLSGLGFEKPPEFKGFSAKPFENEKTYTLNINGILYQVTQVDYVIIPKETGTFTIDPAVLIANVMMKSNRNQGFNSLFNDSFFSSNNYKPVRIVSNALKIEVSPIPSYQGPDKFSGLVGRFGIEGNIDKTSLKAGESVTFTIKISGSGNIMDAGLPDVFLDDDVFKVYDDNPVETIQLTDTGYEGAKIFKKAIVPVIPGHYNIKPVSLVYFDVDLKAYQTVSTDEIKLDVAPSEEMNMAVSPLNQEKDKTIVKEEVSLINKDILEIKEGLEVLKDYREMDLTFFVLMLLIPAILFSGVRLFLVIAKRDVSIEKQMEEKARHHLRQAGKTDLQDMGFLSHLYSSLVAFILARAGKKGETVTLNEARMILEEAELNPASINEITRLMETIESVRFGGKKIDEETAKQILSKTRQVVKLFCTALLCLGLFFPVPQKAFANSTVSFMEGIKNYRAGHYREAASEFEAIARKKIKNPYLFYNIANAYLKANDIGHAILWYERAKILSPNDPDLNFNLAYANTLVKDKPEAAMNIMDVIFFWDSLVRAKNIQVTAVFFSFVFFTWAGIRVVRQKKIFSGTGIMLFSLLVLVTAITCVNYYKRSARLNAVIISEEAAVRSGVTDTSTELFSLHAGTRVRVEKVRDGYLKIEFSKGKVGWVKKEQAVII